MGIGMEPERAEQPPLRDPRSYTPDRLAERMMTSGRALEGERKLVTVLFADVVGSMELAERLGPEEWRRVMDRCCTIVCEAVHRFEGMVDKFTGDGAMALFGAPLAQADPAARACQAPSHRRGDLPLRACRAAGTDPPDGGPRPRGASPGQARCARGRNCTPPRGSRREGAGFAMEREGASSDSAHCSGRGVRQLTY